jgi:hypothetical protein
MKVKLTAVLTAAGKAGAFMCMSKPCNRGHLPRLSVQKFLDAEEI